MANVEGCWRGAKNAVLNVTDSVEVTGFQTGRVGSVDRCQQRNGISTGMRLCLLNRRGMLTVEMHRVQKKLAIVYVKCGFVNAWFRKNLTKFLFVVPGGSCWASKERVTGQCQSDSHFKKNVSREECCRTNPESFTEPVHFYWSEADYPKDGGEVFRFMLGGGFKCSSCNGKLKAKVVSSDQTLNWMLSMDRNLRWNHVPRQLQMQDEEWTAKVCLCAQLCSVPKDPGQVP